MPSGILWFMPGGPCCGEITCTIAEDNFNRADSTSIGSSWDIVSGTQEINSNTLIFTSSPGLVLHTTTNYPELLRHYIEAKISGADGDRLRLVVMGRDEDNYYYVELKVGTDARLRIVKHTESGDEQLGVDRIVTAAADTWHTLKVCVTGLGAQIQATLVVGESFVGMMRDTGDFVPSAKVGIGADGSAAKFDDFLFSRYYAEPPDGLPEGEECPRCESTVDCDSCDGGLASYWVKVVISGFQNDLCDCSAFNGTYFLEIRSDSPCAWLANLPGSCGSDPNDFNSIRVGIQSSGGSGEMFCGLTVMRNGSSHIQWHVTYFDELPDCLSLNFSPPYEFDQKIGTAFSSQDGCVPGSASITVTSV